MTLSRRQFVLAAAADFATTTYAQTPDESVTAQPAQDNSWAASLPATPLPVPYVQHVALAEWSPPRPRLLTRGPHNGESQRIARFDAVEQAVDQPRQRQSRQEAHR